jgi:hypothetical protein
VVFYGAAINLLPIQYHGILFVANQTGQETENQQFDFVKGIFVGAF